jgi:hypothetical protein
MKDENVYFKCCLIPEVSQFDNEGIGGVYQTDPLRVFLWWRHFSYSRLL